MRSPTSRSRRRSVVPRRMPLLLPLFALLSLGCGGDSGDDITDPTDGGTIETNMTVGDTTFDSDLSVASGATLTVEGTDVEVRGSLTIEEGARIEGADPDRLNLVVRGDLTHRGSIVSNGTVAVVSRPGLVPSDEELRGTEESFMGVTEPQSDPDTEDRWEIRGRTVAGAGGSTASAVSRGGGTASAGAPGTPGSVKKSIWWSNPRGVGALGGTDSEFEERESGDGGAGGDDDQCGGTGGDGGDGGVLKYRFAELAVGNLRLKVGDGGPGGSAVASGCADGTTNTGGDGGDPGHLVLWGINEIRVVGTIEVQKASGGQGGMADISGEDGDPGASVTAIGGDGGDVQNIEVDIPRGSFGENGDLVFKDCCNGGQGGLARAAGGNGNAYGECSQTGHEQSSHGGDATAEGGTGGEVTAETFNDNIFVKSEGTSFESGDGGAADSEGGTANDGLEQGQCPEKHKAPHGGDGGWATSQPGDAGAHNVPLGSKGSPGNLVQAKAKDGGNGGDVDAPPGGDGIPGDGGDAGCSPNGGTDGSEGKKGSGGKENQAENGRTCDEQEGG